MKKQMKSRLLKSMKEIIDCDPYFIGLLKWYDKTYERHLTETIISIISGYFSFGESKIYVPKHWNRYNAKNFKYGANNYRERLIAELCDRASFDSFWYYRFPCYKGEDDKFGRELKKIPQCVYAKAVRKIYDVSFRRYSYSGKKRFYKTVRKIVAHYLKEAETESRNRTKDFLNAKEW